MSTSASSRLFSRGISISTVLLIFLGVWLCFLAFSLVRAIAFWLLYHMIGIAAFAAAAIVVLLACWISRSACKP